MFSIGLVSGLSYVEIFKSTEENANIRIDRAARAAAAILHHGTNEQLVPMADEQGRPLAIILSGDPADAALRAGTDLDELILTIGRTNQGAANMFVWVPETAAFDRIATTFRRPDGGMPPPFAIKDGHPAFANLVAGQPFTGSVPVQGRMRLAYLMPVIDTVGTVLGAAAVDVGWVDDLTLAADRLSTRVFTAAAVILLCVILFGGIVLRFQLAPLRRLAAAAHRLASGQQQSAFPCAERKDEIGDLAHGLARVTELQDKLQKLAYVDPVTTAGNRTRYFADLTDALSVGDRRAVLYHLDFTGFAKINDTFGQRVGNRVLMQAYARISGLFGPDSQISRISADDFCIVQGKNSEPAQAGDLAARTIEALSKPFQLDEGEIRVEPCIGIALLPQDGKDPETAHRVAGLALRAARENSHQRYMFFSSPLNDRVQTEMILETNLRSALNARDMRLHYQPQICPESGRLIGLEALARWPNGAEYAVPPSKFIPLAEKTGLILDLGGYVIEETVRQASEWLAGGFDFGQVSVNVSPIEFRQTNFASYVNDTLVKHGLPPERLCLEITENVFVDTSEKLVLDVLSQLQAIGVRLSLDDFGAGYSSLSYLHQLPFQELKIDRTFLKDADKYPQKRQLYEGIVRLGKSLGLKVVAEGAETEGEYALTVGLKCDGIQGFFCSPAVAAEEVEKQTTAICRTMASDHLRDIRRRA